MMPSRCHVSSRRGWHCAGSGTAVLALCVVRVLATGSYSGLLDRVVRSLNVGCAAPAPVWPRAGDGRGETAASPS